MSRQRHPSRRQCLVGVGSLAGAGLAGCLERSEGGLPADDPDEGAGSDGESPASASAWAWNDPNLDGARRGLADGYEQTTGRALRWQTFPFGEFGTKFTNALNGSNAPDALQQTVMHVPQFASKDVLTPASELGFSRDRFMETAAQNAAYEGTMYGVPWFFDCRLMAINVDHFRDAGIEVPDPTEAPSFETFANWIDQLATEDRAAYAMLTGQGYSNLMLCNGGRVVDEDLTTATINETPAVEALEFVERLVVEDETVDAMAFSGSNPVVPAFLNERASMAQVGSWMYGQLKDSADFEWQFLPFPVGPSGDSSHSWSGGVYLSVPSKGGANVEHGRALLEYATRPAVQAKIVEQAGGFPGLEAAYETEAFTSYIEEEPKLETVVQEMENTLSRPRHPKAGQMREAVTVAAEKVWQEQATPQEALDGAATEIQGMLDG